MNALARIIGMLVQETGGKCLKVENDAVREPLSLVRSLFPQGQSASAARRYTVRSRGKWHVNHTPGAIIAMSDRDYVVAKDGSYRLIAGVEARRAA